MSESLNTALSWLADEGIQSGATLVALLVYLLITRFAFPRIEQGVTEGRFKSEATVKAFRVVRLFTAILVLATLLIIWGFDFSGLLLVTTSIITLTGIALFASWSILSNITASLVLIVHKSYRRGNFIRVVEADNYIEGYIAEVNLFNTRLITEARETIIYPNNLLISRPTMINPKTRLAGMGKITNGPVPEKDSSKAN